MFHFKHIITLVLSIFALSACGLPPPELNNAPYAAEYALEEYQDEYWAEDSSTTEELDVLEVSSDEDESDEEEVEQLSEDEEADEEESEVVDEVAEDDAETPRADTKITTSGRYIYLLCIYGDRDTGGKVIKKCNQMENTLKAAYSGSPWNMRVIRVNNPTEEQLENINKGKGKDIAFVVVCTHSTPGDTEGEWDVWNCTMQPEDIADAFEDEWVIWNGCFSKPICEEAVNLLPVQSEEACLDVRDESWRRVVYCLEQSFGRPMSQEEVCNWVFGEK